MSPKELEEFATRYTAAWCSHDADAVASFFAQDGSITVNDGDRAVGRAALAEVFQGFFDAFPDTVVLMDHIRGAGRRAIYSWTYEGTNTAQVGTGNAVRFSGWEAWTFSDEGLVQESIGTFDVNEYERQLAHGL
ncbi:MAG: SgcJ/EcaC family oxidoreductase, partial [Acidimicrobiia bacterium]